MKVYAIRVDSVCNDIRRLGYGIVPSTYFNWLVSIVNLWQKNFVYTVRFFSLSTDNTKKNVYEYRKRFKNVILYFFCIDETSQRSRGKNLVNEDQDLDEPARKSLKKKRKRASTLILNSCQSNAPLACIFPPDSLDYKINGLGDMGASSRLFLSVLPVKNSLLSLNSNEKFIDSSSYDHIKVPFINFWGTLAYSFRTLKSQSI